MSKAQNVKFNVYTSGYYIITHLLSAHKNRKSVREFVECLNISSRFLSGFVVLSIYRRLVSISSHLIHVAESLSTSAESFIFPIFILLTLIQTLNPS